VLYPLKAARLEKGDLLALYSDGVTEAGNADDVEFGEAGLSRFLVEHRYLPCKELVHHLMEHVREWHGNASFTDDFTLLLVKRDNT
jgi:sigma-B regulation protein RsbU (phosphoserine phosphatase)